MIKSLSSKKVEVSVCMATYNGDKYVKEQIDSILSQIGKQDELIVVDDHSTDATVEIINSFDDSRIFLVKNDINLGVNKSFEKAIALSKGEYIFLSDQDDIWTPKRVSFMRNALDESCCHLVSTNFTLVDSDGEIIACQQPYQLSADSSKSYAKNLSKIFFGGISYYGCAMSFKRELLDYIIPFPNYIESHDLWIACASNILRSNVHLENHSLLHRIHGNNASVLSRPLLAKVWSRILILISVLQLINRVYRNDKAK